MTYTHTIETGYPVSIPQAGDRVRALLDDEQTTLIVLRVEPMLVCRKPDGSELTLFAHEVEPVDEDTSS